MGLDVYLYKCANRPAAKEAEEKAETTVEKMRESYGEYDAMTEEAKEEARQKAKAIRASFGCDDYGQYLGVSKIELDSAIFPDHLFKIGYFRSSYNDAGTEYFLRNNGINTMREIFGVNGDEYEQTPDWAGARKRCAEAVKTMSEAKPLLCFAVSGTHNSPPADVKTAIAITKKELERDKGIFDGGYSNRYGYFYPEGITIHAIVPGKQYGQQCSFIVMKQKEGDNWYLNALKIVAETIDYVLAQPDSGDHYLHWSG